MKTRLERTSKNGEQYVIKICLDDECKNGRHDFSITGSIYKPGRPRTGPNCLHCGAIGDEIAKEFPDLAIFDRLHLRDFNGCPMYTVANGFYLVKQMDITEFCNYFRCTQAERDQLYSAENEGHFAILLYHSDIPRRWKQEAETAIQMLEQMTGEKWVNDSVRSNFLAPDNEILADFEKKQNAGYFSPEQTAQRENAKKQEAYKIAHEKIKSERDARIQSANTQYAAKLAVLNAGLSLKNFIFYNHTNTGVFNWLDYGEKITRDQFDAFVSSVNVKGVKFEIKEYETI